MDLHAATLFVDAPIDMNPPFWHGPEVRHNTNDYVVMDLKPLSIHVRKSQARMFANVLTFLAAQLVQVADDRSETNHD